MIWQFMKFPLNCHGKIPEKKSSLQSKCRNDSVQLLCIYSTRCLCLCVGCFTTIRSGRRNEALRIYKLKGSVLPTFPLAGQGHEILDCWPPFSLVMMSLRVQMFSTDDFRYPLHDVHPQVGSQLLSIFFFFLEIGRRAGIEITPNAALDLRRRAQEENGSEKRWICSTWNRLRGRPPPVHMLVLKIIERFLLLLILCVSSMNCFNVYLYTRVSFLAHCFFSFVSTVERRVCVL